MNNLSDNTFITYAMNCYDNPSCHDIIEFEEDLKRFQYIRKLFSRYEQSGELRERLILNHLIILYNVFGLKASDMLFMKLEGYHELLKPFVDYLQYNSEYVEYNGKKIMLKNIKVDVHINNKLKGI